MEIFTCTHRFGNTSKSGRSVSFSESKSIIPKHRGQIGNLPPTPLKAVVILAGFIKGFWPQCGETRQWLRALSTAACKEKRGQTGFVTLTGRIGSVSDGKGPSHASGTGLHPQSHRRA